MRVSYENGVNIITYEGLRRTSYYYYEANICTINTSHTISTLVSKYIKDKQVHCPAVIESSKSTFIEVSSTTAGYLSKETYLNNSNRYN